MSRAPRCRRGLYVGFMDQSLQLENGRPVSRGRRLARLADEGFPGLALQYACRAEEVRGVLAYRELLASSHKRLDGRKARQHPGILNECHQKMRMLVHACLDGILGDDRCQLACRLDDDRHLNLEPGGDCGGNGRGMLRWRARPG